MRTLIIARHGDYERTPEGALTPEGRRQFERLAAIFKEIARDGKVAILSSPSLRARESAHIIGEALNVEVEIHDLLWSGPDKPSRAPEVLALVESKSDCDVVIVVTHFEDASDLHELYICKATGFCISLEDCLEKGEAWLIVCKGPMYCRVSGRSG